MNNRLIAVSQTETREKLMQIRQLMDLETNTYTYLIIDMSTRKAALVDPVLEALDRDVKLIKELGLSLESVLETHIHADHVTSAYYLRKETGCKIILPKNAKARNIDQELSHDDTLMLGETPIKALETSGHTDAHMAYHVNNVVLTGDALLVRGCGRTDFQGGDAGKLYDNVTQHVLSLPPATTVYPGHDYNGCTRSTVGEEKKHNPRFIRSRKDFIELMSSLKLAKPKRMRYAVPLNLRLGQIPSCDE